MSTTMDKAVTWLVSLYPKRMFGVDDNVLSRFLVENLGSIGALRWTLKNGPRAQRTIKEWGGLRANLMFAIASLLNGCAFCLFAQGRAFELYYFERFGKLFPLDQHELLNLIPLSDEASKERLEQALRESGLNDEIPLFRRLYALKLEGAEPTPADSNLVHAIEMYDMLNFCAISGQLELDEAHDVINKNDELKRRYAEARLAAGRRKVVVDDLLAVEQAARASSDGLDTAEENGKSSV